LQYLKDQARIPGRGERLVNMIHRDDLAACIVVALKSGRPGEIYNASDDEPVPQIHFFRWLSETLGKNMQPAVRARGRGNPVCRASARLLSPIRHAAKKK
jgi:nucleoside-diphosphate-sugar epimerase